MPRKSRREAESWKDFDREMVNKKNLWMSGTGPWMWHGGFCCNKGHKIGAFIFAGSVLWIMNITGTIPPSVPWLLEFLTALGFAAMI